MTATLVPELARASSLRTEHRPGSFNLRKGVEFHNGKTMTADDVIATFNYHRDENSKSAAKGLLSAVKEIKKDGDNQVIFELDGGNADFPYIVSDYHIMIMPSEGGSDH
jgi:peptide/nickel transport system substrate-binding protein